MKGILLAGGLGTRLWPMTLGTSKQLLPVYDKPAVYYPLSTLLGLDIREVLIISSPRDLPALKNLLGDGSQFGIQIQYAEQVKPNGIAEAYLIGKKFLNGEKSVLILGDNLFFGIANETLTIQSEFEGAKVFAYKVPNPRDYGNVLINEKNQVEKIIEKPVTAISNLAVTGLYFLDSSAPAIAASLEKSQRGELEITDLLEMYRTSGRLSASVIPDGAVWMDMGTIPSITAAAEYVRILQERQGLLIGSPHMIAVGKNWISNNFLINLIGDMNSHYANAIRTRLS